MSELRRKGLPEIWRKDKKNIDLRHTGVKNIYDGSIAKGGAGGLITKMMMVMMREVMNV